MVLCFILASGALRREVKKHRPCSSEFERAKGVFRTAGFVFRTALKARNLMVKEKVRVKTKGTGKGREKEKGKERAKEKKRAKTKSNNGYQKIQKKN